MSEDITQRYAQEIDEVDPLFRTRAGEELYSRLIRPDDAELLADFAYNLSPETRRRRFHQNVDHLSDEQVQAWARELADVDNLTGGGAVLALQRDDACGEAIVGVARLGRVPGKTDDPAADAAIVVRDDYQGQGVGTELLRRLVLLARRMGVRQMVAMIQSDNKGAIRLFRNLGLPTETTWEPGETILTIEMP